MEKEDNFQTVNMIYKMEKIKKRKQKKYPKKMDMFDTLENPSANIQNSILTSQSKGKSLIEPFDQNSSAEKTKIIEPIINLSADDIWDGKDKEIVRKENQNTIGDFQADMRAKINDAYDTINSFNRNIASTIVIAMSGKAPEDYSMKRAREFWHLPDTKKKEGFSWDTNDIDDAIGEDSNNNIDYKLQQEAELDAQTKDDTLAKTEEYLKSAADRLFSGETIDAPASAQDVDIIQKYIGWFEALVFAYYAAYNWYFLMFNLERGGGENDDEIEDVRYRPTRKWLEDIYYERTPPRWLGTTGAYILLFIFEFPLFFPEMMDKFLLDIVPKYSRNILNGAFCFIILFYLLFYLFTRYVSTFKDFFIDYLNGNLKNVMFGIIFFVMIALYIFSLFKFGSAGASKFNDAFIKKKPPTTISDFIMLEQAKMMDEANKISSTAKKFNLFTIGNFIVFDTIIRLIVLITVGVPVAALFIGLYIFIYSFFGIFIYNQPWKTGGDGFWKHDGKNTFDKIAENIENHSGKSDYNIDPDTYGEYFSNVFVLMNKFSLIAHSKIFTIGYLVISLMACVDFLNISNIKSVFPVKTLKMKELLILFVLVLFVAVSTYAYNTTDTELIKEILNPNYKPKTNADFANFEEINKIAKQKQALERTAFILERQRIEREENPNLNLLGFRTNEEKPRGQQHFGVGEEINLKNVKQNAAALISKAKLPQISRTISGGAGTGPVSSVVAGAVAGAGTGAVAVAGAGAGTGPVSSAVAGGAVAGGGRVPTQ